MKYYLVIMNNGSILSINSYDSEESRVSAIDRFEEILRVSFPNMQLISHNEVS